MQNEETREREKGIATKVNVNSPFYIIENHVVPYKNKEIIYRCPKMLLSRYAHLKVYVHNEFTINVFLCVSVCDGGRRGCPRLGFFINSFVLTFVYK